MHDPFVYIGHVRKTIQIKNFKDELTLSPVDPPYGGVEYQLWQKKSEKSPDAQNFKLELSEHAQRAALFIHHSYNGDIIGLLRENIIFNSTVNRVARETNSGGVSRAARRL